MREGGADVCSSDLCAQRERCVYIRGKALATTAKLARQTPLGGRQQQLFLRKPCRRIDLEPESVEPADRLALNRDRAVLVNLGDQIRCPAADVAQKHRGAAVDKAAGQPLVKREIGRASGRERGGPYV